MEAAQPDILVQNLARLGPLEMFYAITLMTLPSVTVQVKKSKGLEITVCKA